MRPFQFPLLVLLISQLNTPSLAAPAPAPAPISTSSDTPSALLAPRGDSCHNAPNTHPGSSVSHRSPPHPHPPRGPSFPPDPPSITWCDLHSSTYLIITASHVLVESSVEQILDDASLFVTQMIQRGGDGLIPRGFWTLEEYGLQLAFQNADNHQQTWGVVGAALLALLEYFTYRVQMGSVRAIQFQVWDGRNHVGSGWLRG